MGMEDTASTQIPEACECCGKNVPKEGVSDYCPECWEAVVTPAYRHVESLKPDMRTPFPAWHGWAVREAFIAGAASQIRLANTGAEPSQGTISS